MSKKNTMEICMVDKNGVKYVTAIYDVDKNEIEILKGSKYNIGINHDLPDSVLERRQYIEDEEMVDVTNGKFDRDVTVKSNRKNSTPLSPAASIVLNYRVSGPKTWKFFKEGKYVPLKDILECDMPDKVGKTAKESVGDDSIVACNTIFYGVPGCGKSHHVNDILGIKKDGSGLDGKYYKRVLFHPEYSYSDFVGQIMPVTENGAVSYSFVPGPFTEILASALEDTENQYFLIIEEINRGNAPAIFGDIFQLLDRDSEGDSEYAIYNKRIQDALADRGVEVSEISIPQNLASIATMNTCDQNVFTMDTAFKRRWRMRRIPNNLSDSALANAYIGNIGITWGDFAKAVNNAILANCNDGMAAEDKQLGAYFVKEKELGNAQIFAQKVMLYLWDDVAKYDRGLLFDPKYNTLDDVINDFVKGKNVFAASCTDVAELYKNNENGNGDDKGAE